MRRLLPASLVLLACACGGGGRDFKSPKMLSEGRPTRTPAMPESVLEDEPFRAKPPERIAAKARPLPTPTEIRLSNGIRVVLLERHDFPSISAVMFLDRGSTAAGPGVAALYSETLTGSSDEYKSTEAWQYLAFVGGTVNTYPWYDGTALQVTALTPLFVSALSRAAPMFTSPALDGDDLDDARTHLAAQHASSGEDPAEVASDALYAAVFPPPHPYAVPIFGELARSRKRAKNAPATLATNADVKAFRDAYLSADRVGVAVVGDFKPASIQRTLEAVLGKLPKHAVAATPPFPALAPKGGRKVLVIDRPGAAQSAVAIGWPGPRAADAAIVTLEVLSSATAGDLSTRLNITVRKELGASYGVRMSASGFREAGIIRIAAAIDTARTVEAMGGLFKQLERLRTEPLSAGELGAAKLRTYYDYDRGSTRGLARHLAGAMAEGLPPANMVTHNARVDVVDAEAVRAAAERWLTLDEARIVVVGDASRIADGLRKLGLGEVTVVSGQ